MSDLPSSAAGFEELPSLDNSFNLPPRKHGIDLGQVVLKGWKSAMEPEEPERRRKSSIES